MIFDFIPVRKPVLFFLTVTFFYLASECSLFLIPKPSGWESVTLTDLRSYKKLWKSERLKKTGCNGGNVGDEKARYKSKGNQVKEKIKSKQLTDGNEGNPYRIGLLVGYQVTINERLIGMKSMTIPICYSSFI